MSTDPSTGLVNTSGAIGDIVIPVGSLKKPVATTQFTLDLNLNSSAAADATSSFSTPIEVFDSLGSSHVLTVNFEKTAPSTWSYSITIPPDEVTGSTAGVPFEVDSGSIEFDSKGQLVDPQPPDTIDFDVDNLTSGADTLTLKWNPFFDSGAGRITQFGQPSQPSANSQNGSASAQLVRVGLADGGRILAQYSNGIQVNVGQVAMASIRNPESLIAAGNNNYLLSAETASPAVGLPGTGGRGTILGGAIEFSTVDIAREFTNLIVLQRGYQANSRVVTTVDEMSQETINLKR
jgi:flagellar hook protein FlgE